MFKYIYLSLLFIFLSSIPTYGIEFNEENPHPELVAAIKSFDKEKVREVLSRVPKFNSEREWWHYVTLVSKAEGPTYIDQFAQTSGWSGVATRLGALLYPAFWMTSRRRLSLHNMEAGWLEGVNKSEAPIRYYLNKSALYTLAGTAIFTVATTLLYKYYVNKSRKGNVIRKMLRQHKN